ncbi:MAG: dihydrofolate reductase family protein [Methanococcaceae archaeon]
MKKLKLQMQLSIDGSPQYEENDEQLWVTWAWDQIKNHVLGLLDSSDTILLGRKLAVDYIPYWEKVFLNTDDLMFEVAKRIVNDRKIVFTKTLDKSVWSGTELAKGNLVEEVNKLKNQNGKDIIVYGGTSFVSELIKEGLIDEFHFFLNPVALGTRGVPVFNKLDSYLQLKLKKTITYDCGIVLLNYERE